MNPNFKPYYAVIFTSTQKSNIDGYAQMANKMEELAKKQYGYLGLESSRSDLGITVSYWESLEAIKNWKQQAEHLEAQKQGKTKWYNWYKIRVCKVEREYEFSSLDN